MNPYGIAHENTPKPLTGLCEGRWKLFDATNPDLANQARSLCDRCPVLLACREQRDAWLGSSTTARGQVEGTWAGRTYGEAYTSERRSEAMKQFNATAGARPLLTHCKRGHAFDEANTYVSPTGQRQCRQCRNASFRAAKKRAAERRRKDAA